MSDQVAKVELVKLFNRMAEEVKAGRPLLASLRRIESEFTGTQVQKSVAALGDAIEKGDTLSQALGRNSALFEPGVVALVEGGEKAGWLQNVLPVVADYIGR